MTAQSYRPGSAVPGRSHEPDRARREGFRRGGVLSVGADRTPSAERIQMNPKTTAATAALALAALGAGAAVAASGPTVKLASTSAGKLLVNRSGFTVYEFTADHRNSD